MNTMYRIVGKVLMFGGIYAIAATASEPGFQFGTLIGVACFGIGLDTYLESREASHE